MKRLLTIALTLLFLTASAFADDAAEVGKSLTVRTFQFKYKKAENAATAIKSLMSAEGSMSIRPAANSLVVTDLAENMKKIVATLADFDVEAQPFRLTVRLVSAGRATAAGDAHIAAELRDLAPKLAMLRYNILDPIGDAEVTGKEGDSSQIDLTGYRADFKFGEYDPASDSINLVDFKLSRLAADQLAPLMKTTLNLKLGQTLIIGATKQPQSQRALMIVFTAKR